MSVQYRVLYTNPEQDLFTRLFQLRNISDELKDFLHPTFKKFRVPGKLLSDFDKWIDRIITAIQKQEKVMIFGDYDVDGVVSSYIMYVWLRQFLGLENISVRLPHRAKDGYGIKSYHLDEIAQLWCSLVITVDNGITAVKEALHAQELGIDMLITDHHRPLAEMPQWYAVINPQCSPEYPMKDICGATVALKVVMGVADALGVTRERKKEMLDRLLPFASIATVADCMPLIGENRLIVKQGLSAMNSKREGLAPALQILLDYLNIQHIDTYHIGFMIAPRINASGRVAHAEEALKCLLASDASKQLAYLERLDELNGERRQLQEQMIKEATQLVDNSFPLIVAASTTFHEGVIGIVAGRLADKFNKPTVVMSIDEEKWIAVGSLRWPDYFHITKMLQSADDLLLRYGWHAQAGGLTVDVKNLDEMVERLQWYCKDTVQPQSLEKVIQVDTHLYAHEFEEKTMAWIGEFWPYGEGNAEPTFLLENLTITHIEKVGKNWWWHLKLHGSVHNRPVNVLQRWKWETTDQYTKWNEHAIIWRPKKDSYSGGRYMEWIEIV